MRKNLDNSISNLFQECGGIRFYNITSIEVINKIEEFVKTLEKKDKYYVLEKLLIRYTKFYENAAPSEFEKKASKDPNNLKERTEKASLAIIEWIEESLSEKGQKDKSDNEKPKFSHIEIALFHYYINDPIEKKNHNQIAKKYGWTSPTSGHKLYLIFNYCRKAKINRTGDGTKKSNLNRIKYFKNVISLLNEKGLREPARKAQGEFDEFLAKISPQKK